MEGLKHLVEVKTTYLWFKRFDCNIVEELAALNKLHHDVGDWDFAAISFDFESVGFELEALNNVGVLQLKQGFNFLLKVAEHLGVVVGVLLVEDFDCHSLTVGRCGQLYFG